MAMKLHQVSLGTESQRLACHVNEGGQSTRTRPPSVADWRLLDHSQEER